jgi:hypothetical protein
MKLLNYIFRAGSLGISAFLVYDVLTRKVKPLSPDIPVQLDGRLSKPEELFLAALFLWGAFAKFPD